MTLELDEVTINALKIIIVYVLINADRKVYNQAEILLKWAQDNNLME